jgi:aspartyl-tRNA(Asn)/glutamyl-tRNA(Gln) amidotransferase subunit A
MDRELERGIVRGALHGVPIAVKDIIRSAEGPTLANSPVLRDDPEWAREEAYDAAVVGRLRKHGAILVGKVSLSEFAVAECDPDDGFPVPRNPWAADRWPGGSSSGTAVGVAAGLFPGGLGTDTGGSVRIPAALCGISGLKPTYGRVPNRGCLPLSESQDTVGPIGRTAEDCAVLLAALAGFDPEDPTTARVPVDAYGEGVGSLSECRVGVWTHTAPRDEKGLSVDPDISCSFEQALTVLRGSGASTREVLIESYDAGRDAGFITLLAEAFNFHRRSLQVRPASFGTRARLMLAQGAFVSAFGYLQAQRVRRIAKAEVDRVLSDVDVLVMPTVAFSAPLISELDDDGFSSRLLTLLNTPFWNFTGHPALSVPMGFSTTGMPLGLQIVGRAFDEAAVLKVGAAFQAVTDWHLARPILPDGPNAQPTV